MRLDFDRNAAASTRHVSTRPWASTPRADNHRPCRHDSVGRPGRTDDSQSPPAASRAAVMIALVVAGELIFSLPFHVPRYFRPSVLAALGLSNAGLGDVFAVYGVTAMLAYFPGGLLADRLSARLLM